MTCAEFGGRSVGCVLNDARPSPAKRDYRKVGLIPHRTRHYLFRSKSFRNAGTVVQGRKFSSGAISLVDLK